MIKRVVLVTGASSGIGLATAQKLLQEKHKVIGLSRKKPSIIDPLFSFIPLDLSKLKHIPEALEKLVIDFPEIDAIVANAAQGHFDNLEEISYSKIKEIIELNFLSQAFLAKAFLPSLKKKPRADLIFIGSEAALKGKKKGSIYCASKFALRGFAQALREECASSQVRVSLIKPGMARTPFYQQLSFAPSDEAHSALEADDIASCVQFLLGLHSRAVCDEILLSPLKKSLQFKRP